jgi:hypothetical protein
MYLECSQNPNRADHGQCNTAESGMKSEAREESDGCGQKTDKRKQSRTCHPAGDLGMSKDLICHHNERRTEQKAKAGVFGK